MKRRLPTTEAALESLALRMKKHSLAMPNGCIEWTGSRTRGYGYISVWSGDKGTPTRAHRVAYAIANKLPLPFSGVVMHTCDNPSCINADHLRLSTQAENMRDKKLKGRNQFGSKCSYAKLTETDVSSIRADTRAQAAIAEEYGLTQQTVSDIKRRRIWKHVA